MTITASNRSQLKSKLGQTPALTASKVDSFDVLVTKARTTYDIHVVVNGQAHFIAFAPKAGGAKGYHLVVLETQFGETLKDHAAMFEYLTSDSINNGGGLTIAEVRSRAHILAGLYLAARATASATCAHGYTECRPAALCEGCCQDLIEATV